MTNTNKINKETFYNAFDEVIDRLKRYTINLGAPLYVVEIKRTSSLYDPIRLGVTLGGTGYSLTAAGALEIAKVLEKAAELIAEFPYNGYEIA